MLIIPAIYLSGGNAVSRYKGEKEQLTVLTRDPFSAVKKFEKQGAKIIHLVDLDAKDGGSELNKSIAKSIVQKTSLKVWYADGVSSIKDIGKLLDAGIAAVSLNQFAENLAAEAIQKFGADKIFFTIRAQRNIIEGKPKLEVFHYGQDLVELGLKNIIFRDTKVEGSFHPNFDEIERLVLGCKAETGHCTAKIFAFGGIGAIDDIEILKRTGAAGVIISRAFFENRFSLSECIQRFGG
ncbi:hypothetical protein HZC21_00720 [Candidatus Peregrinibacteria bacterium]|nr:hypothetical protein [Candidatus Peregrinibacteria bacterium]